MARFGQLLAGADQKVAVVLTSPAHQVLDCGRRRPGGDDLAVEDWGEFGQTPSVFGRRPGPRPISDLVFGDLRLFWPVVENRLLADQRQRAVTPMMQIESGLRRGSRRCLLQRQGIGKAFADGGDNGRG